MRAFVRRHHQFFWVNFGCLVFALAYIFFFNDHRITPGGLAGVSLIVQCLTGVSFGMVNVALNIPGIVLGLYFLGPKSIALTIYAILASSAMIDIGSGYLPALTNHSFVAAVAGAVVQGLGLGILFNANASIGGTALIGLLINHQLPKIKLGTILLLADGAIVLLSFFVFLILSWPCLACWPWP